MEKLHKVGSTVTERAREVAKGLQQSGFMRSSIYVHECADALEAKDAEIARLQASDDALGKIHQICHDAGIAEGHAVERVRLLAARKAAGLG